MNPSSFPSAVLPASEVYAATLDQWMGGDSEVVLGQKFSPLGVFA